MSRSTGCRPKSTPNSWISINGVPDACVFDFIGFDLLGAMTSPD
jgi:hypothetical protein